MEPNLQAVEATNFTGSERAIFNVLKATLQYPARPATKAAKLVDDIRFFCKSAEDDGGGYDDEILWDVWSVVIDLVCYMPPDHPWQDSVVQALSSLHQRDDAISEQNKVRKAHKQNGSRTVTCFFFFFCDIELTNILFGNEQSSLWKDIPNLAFCMTEKWSGLELELSPLTVAPAVLSSLDPTYTGTAVSEEFSKWKNLNSFVARLTKTGYAPWLTLPIWELRAALEEPLAKGPALECRLWVATEWIIYCADPIFKYMNTKGELDVATARSLRAGSLGGSSAPVSVERWEFWKKRFDEFSADASNLELGSEMTGRLVRALECMSVMNEPVAAAPPLDVEPIGDASAEPIAVEF
jgi:hypothetical protein